jgi:hypothetical protein
LDDGLGQGIGDADRCLANEIADHIRIEMRYCPLDGGWPSVRAVVVGATKESCCYNQRRGTATSTSYLDSHPGWYQYIITG